MTNIASRLQRKMQTAAGLLIAGLAVQGVTLYWAHPTSFVLFIILGGILVLAGIAVYLFALITD